MSLSISRVHLKCSIRLRELKASYSMGPEVLMSPSMLVEAWEQKGHAVKGYIRLLTRPNAVAVTRAAGQTNWTLCAYNPRNAAASSSSSPHNSLAKIPQSLTNFYTRYTQTQVLSRYKGLECTIFHHPTSAVKTHSVMEKATHLFPWFIPRFDPDRHPSGGI